MKKTIAIVLIMFGILISVIGAAAKVKKNASISIIGGADGPTSIFLAGKVGGNFPVVTIIIGFIVILFSIIMLIRKNKK